MMAVIGVVFRLTGGLCLFLYGMKVMSDGIQQAAGDRLQRVLNFMTGNRLAGVLTGFAVTAVIQSSSAVTVMVVSFVNAGLLTLTQSIGVIMGANIGTTVTAWIVSLVGFSLKLSALALPAVGVGYILKMIRWKRQTLGEVILGFGLLFMGLDFLTQSMPPLGEGINLIVRVSNLGFLSILIGAGAGLVITLLIHSSSASTAIMLTMAFNGVVGYEMAASMILGANVGTTIDAALAAIGARTAAKRAALVHVLFNVIGTLWAVILLKPLLALVDLVTPGSILPGMTQDPVIPTHLAMFHTVFNGLNTLFFFPFVKPFGALVSFLVRERKDEAPLRQAYRFEYKAAVYKVPELAILEAEQEIHGMAGLAARMYGRISAALTAMKEAPPGEDEISALTEKLREEENLADEMREELTAFLIECTSRHLNRQSEQKVTFLLRIVGGLEDMTDDCYSAGLILERSVRKKQLFKHKELNALTPYVALVEEFFEFLQKHLESPLTAAENVWASELENRIDQSRNRLRKMGRKRIEAGQDVKTELLFIDLVRRIENLGDYCYGITQSLAQMR
jgi:phosphate:Na+ symporter